MRTNLLFLSVCLTVSMAMGCSMDGDGFDGDEGPVPIGLVTCANYCGKIMTACSNDAAQYGTMENCMGSCVGFPAGTASDTVGDTLGCRLNHVVRAKGAAAAAECLAAGPGGDNVCGANCEGYCDIAMVSCTGANQVYTDRADCLATCGGTPDDVPFALATDSGAHVACLLSHVTEASTVPEDHCPGDLDKASDSCK